jgi:hypothetical protein
MMQTGHCCVTGARQQESSREANGAAAVHPKGYILSFMHLQDVEKFTGRPPLVDESISL